MTSKRVSVWLLALSVAAWAWGCSSDGGGGATPEMDGLIGGDSDSDSTSSADGTSSGGDVVILPDGQTCTTNCSGGCGLDDGCGGICGCQIGFDCENRQCVERTLTCIQIDKSDHTLYPPAGLRVVFRVTDCDGYPIRKLTQQDVQMINDAKGEPFGAGGEGGGASAPGTPSEYGLYAMLVLDMSDSIFNAGAVNQVLDGARLFVQRSVEQAPAGLKQNVGIMVFGRTAGTRVVQDFTADHTILYEQIEALRTGESLGTTNLYGAYTMAIQEVQGEGMGLELAERAVVILTDGTHEAGDEENQRALALIAKQAGESDNSLTVFSIGIRGNYDESKLRELATRPEYFRIAEDASALSTIFDEFSTRTKAIAESNYAVGVCTPVELGNASLTVKVQVSGTSAEQRISYNADEPGRDLTGDVTSCNPSLIADPCSGRVCGPGALPGSQCGTCLGTSEICTAAGQCQDDCLGLQCGNSPNLGIACGTCSGTTYCSMNQCVDDCVSRQCGTSPRGFDCGTCSGPTEYCSANQCVDDCAGRQCGTSPRGFDCGTCPGASEYCSANQCVDDCTSRQCGMSPRGFDCGTCSGLTEYCSANQCVDDCASRQCGTSPQGFNCGTCSGINDYCTGSGQCVDDCPGRVCGVSSVSGLICGACSGATACNASGQCVNDCGARVCGTSPLGINCGTCSGSTACNASGQCINDCGTRVCGTSSLGINCGICSGSTACNVSGQCINDCGTRVCGTSSLGINCGICSGSTACNVSGQCINDCGTRVCGTSSLGVNCGTCPTTAYCGSGQCVTAPATGTRQVFSTANAYLFIRPSIFTMGAPTNEPERQSNETPHEVTLTRGFWLKETEVTQGEWQAVMGNNPSNFSSCGTSCPVEQVSWWDAVAYCNALSSAQGLTACYTLTGCSGTPGVAGYACSSAAQVASCTGYRLPTEAEWEYAYRAGTTTAFYNGPITQPEGTDPNLELIGWYNSNSGRTTRPVAGKAANAWGLYDMAGNVWEWTWDWYGNYASAPQTDPSGPSSGDTRVARGGAWSLLAQYCRAAQRGSYLPTNRFRYIGFRPARSF